MESVFIACFGSSSDVFQRLIDLFSYYFNFILHIFHLIHLVLSSVFCILTAMICTPNPVANDLILTFLHLGLLSVLLFQIEESILLQNSHLDGRSLSWHLVKSFYDGLMFYLFVFYFFTIRLNCSRASTIVSSTLASRPGFRIDSLSGHGVWIIHKFSQKLFLRTHFFLFIIWL